MYLKNNPAIGITIFSILMIFIWSFSGIAQYEDMLNEQPNPGTEDIGQVDFNVSCDETVREDFNHALGMLHHMMYVAARNNFKEITEKDPNCAMAYWGIATTFFQPLWSTRPGEEELQKGKQNIEKARELVDSEREELLIEATAAFFQEPGTANYGTRLERWVDGMEKAYQAFPEDPDIAAFYGLSRLTTAQRAENREPYHDEAEKVLREVYEKNPTHPGAIHYSIHATDVDGRAENALDMVETYSKIAPEVPHALHMPSHIYVRLGDWPSVIEWNILSAEAALDYPVNGAESHHYIHALDYLTYAYLQRGEDDKAREVKEKALSIDEYQKSLVSAFHLAAIPARLAVEQGDWEQAMALEPRTPDYLPWDAFPWAEGITWYAKGLGAVQTGDINSAQEAEERLVQLRENAKDAGDDDIATYIEIDRRVLSGQIAHARGNNDKAVELTRSAAELEKTIEKHPVTPGALLPPYEALGNLLLDLDRPAEALEAYEASDEIWPDRYKTLLGAARAARDTGNDRAANEYYQRLIENTGDTDRKTLSEARQYINLQ